MSHLSTQGFIVNQIGALEWGADFERPGDGALEATANAGPGPTVAMTNCFPASRPFYCMTHDSPGANP